MEAVRPVLAVQARWSRIPAADELLIERVRTREGHHLFVFPFEGRLVHEGLAALFAYRIARMQPISFTLAANDYGLELLSSEPAPLGAALAGDLLSPWGLLQDVPASLNATEMAKRQFREIARVAGLIFPGYPHAGKTARQLQASSGLFFDVFQRYDPQNLLVGQRAPRGAGAAAGTQPAGANSGETIAVAGGDYGAGAHPTFSPFRSWWTAPGKASRRNRSPTASAGCSSRWNEPRGERRPLELRGERLVLLPERAVFRERTATLLIADPHWGKAATFRASGIPVPRGTTLDGLARLDAMLQRTGARRIIFLGDYLHARQGRSPTTLQALAEWRARHLDIELVLVRGNHDRHAGDPPPELGLAV